MKTVQEWKAYLEAALKTNRECLGNDEQPHELLAHVFDIVTYDGGWDEYFINVFMEVLDSIVNRTTFAYQDISEEHCKNYLMVVNMGNLPPLLSWGTSIRGASIYFRKPWEVDTGCLEVDSKYAVINEAEDFANLYQAMVLFLADKNNYLEEEGDEDA